MNKKDKKGIDLLIHQFRELEQSLDVRTMAMNTVADELQALLPRYTEIVALFSPFKENGDISKIISKIDAVNRKLDKFQDLPDINDILLAVDQPKFVQSKDLQSGPEYGDKKKDRRLTHERKYTSRRTDEGRHRINDRRSNSKILNFFGIGRLKVEL